METLTLQRSDFQKLATFIVSHKIKQCFIGKDHGVYVGATAGGEDNCIFFFEGCNPATDEDWYDTAHARFGGDDFAEYFPASEVTNAANDHTVKALSFEIDETSFQIASLR